MLASLLMALAAATAPAVPAADAVAVDCPAPARSLPLYPADMMRRNVAGTTLVKARTDDCGRVLEATVLEGSGHKALDKAAVDAVRLWVLTDAQRSGAIDGWLHLPVRFGGVRNVQVHQVDWPRSHRRPAYLVDEQPIGFATIAEYSAAKPGRAEPLLASPYASVTLKSGVRTSTWFQQDRENPAVYWLSYVVQIPAAADAPPGTRATLATRAIARYRLVEEQGSAVVRLAFLCEDTPEGCTRLQDFLMQGLPIAKPARS